ncbi:hypothetical protein PEC730217_08220 [Pectobacterium carotovorum subsp. carotovorum]|nr:hypothetical protein PB70LOC_02781 [Pectobacterium versatile]POY62986.1 hypothetical protein PB69LOC_01597 [Pectobacterium versatile]GKW32042.1 hypothetical protein PEC730217_08220 [Pectobacterium carotovorum subsp. carotovorum]
MFVVSGARFLAVATSDNLVLMRTWVTQVRICIHPLVRMRRGAILHWQPQLLQIAIKR